MCGIAGIVNFQGLAEAERESIGLMTQVLHHRGPDDHGVFTDGFTALGHARLSIIDLDAGHQPMSNEDDTIWIVFNGEIYNFPDLRRQLSARGHRFRSHCDTEAIVHLYEEYGDACVDRLRGMFAFAIWDQKRRRLLLARDRVGIKPLYYMHVGERLLFGSEIKAILQAPGVERQIDPEALRDYLTYMWVPAPKSMFRGVRKLPAGHIATFDSNGLRTSEYWDLRFPEPATRDPKGLGEGFLGELTESVKAHLISNVPLGAFLSGGIDSSSIVAVMAGLQAEPVVTNSIGFEEQDYDELPYADLVAQRFRTKHHRQVVQPNVIEDVGRLAWHFDEPFADYSAMPTYRVSKMARENVTVALSGDGGDEIMAGYRRYFLNQMVRPVRNCLPAILRRPLFGTLARLYPKANWMPSIFRAKLAFRNLAVSDMEAAYLSIAFYDQRISTGLIRPDILAELKSYHPRSVMEYHYKRCSTTDPLHRDLYLEFKTLLVEDMLTKVDRTSMAVGLEVRVPLLDHKLVEYAATIPSSLKLYRGQAKYLFREVMRPVLGPEIVDRKKMGFSPPLAKWLRESFRELIHDTIFGHDSYVGSILNMNLLRQLWDAHQSGYGRLMENMLWAILMLELWGRRFMRGAPTTDCLFGSAEPELSQDVAQAAGRR